MSEMECSNGEDAGADPGREEFDAFLGGQLSLPHSSSIKDFVNSRINEIEALSEAIENPQRTAMVFQQLPKRMRRRVMSHNAKRMPNRLKQSHTDLIEKCGVKEVGKRPNRKYRRRPKNLREEYTRRQTRPGNVWLETHVWHAKRFHMISSWGYKLPHHPNDKNFRACYRASAQHCLLQDVSFLCCLELNGAVEDIVCGLSPHTDCSFVRKSEINGAREGSATFKRITGEPIGQVDFMWNWDGSNVSQRQLWIWSHPAFYTQLYNELEKIFSGTAVTIGSLAHQLLRFRLWGPKCLEVLKGAFKPVSSEEFQVDWCRRYYENDERLGDLEIQTEYLNKVLLTSNPGQLPPRSILPALVNTHLPKLPQALREIDVDTDMVLEKPVQRLSSPLWDEQCREAISAANRRGEVSVSSAVHLTSSQTETPVETNPLAVLLIHRPGRQHSPRQGYGCGIDVICPSSWGMRVWLCLVHNGGRAAGLRESDIIQTDVSLRPPFVPDSQASDLFLNSIYNSEREKYFRLPPAKRVNFQKLGISNPFEPQWSKLKEEWRCDELVRVYLISDSKLYSSARICLPLPADTDNRNSPPVEPLCPDADKNKRRISSLKHKRDLRTLAKLRKKLRLKNAPDNELPTSESVVEEHRKLMEKLWLGDTEGIRCNNIRETMGFVTGASYSYLLGKCAGYGYITASALKTIKDVQKNSASPTVLTRNVTSLHYTFANLRIVEKDSIHSSPFMDMDQQFTAE